MGQLWVLSDRTDYDLKQHIEYSKQDLSYFDDVTNEYYVPYVTEPSLGADRVTLAIICAAYDEEKLEDGDIRIVMHFHPYIAPIKIGILPLYKKLSVKVEKIYEELSKDYMWILMIEEILVNDIEDKMK